MSGSNTIPPIPLRFEGAENVQRTIDAIVARVGQLENAGKGAAASMGTLRTQAEQTGGAFRNTGQVIGQAGYQVQDFAVQVASGQSALTAFVQQGSQLAGIFGPGGAIAGAVLAIGGIAAQFLLMGESAEQANKRIGDGFRANQRAGEDLTRVIQALSDELLTASQRAANLANNQRQVLITEGRGHMMRLENERTAAGNDYATASRDLARLERNRAQLERDLASASPRSRASIESDLREAQAHQY